MIRLASACLPVDTTTLGDTTTTSLASSSTQESEHVTDYCSTAAPSSGTYRFSQLHQSCNSISNLQVISTLSVLDEESCAYLCIRTTHHPTGLHCAGFYYTAVSSVCGLISSTITEDSNGIHTTTGSITDYTTTCYILC